MLVFDCETDGLLHELTKLHCLVIRDTLTGETTRYNDQNNGQRPIREGIERLEAATDAGTPIMGHNVIKFDVPAIQKVYPWFNPTLRFVLDSMVLARLTYPDLWDIDAKLRNKGFPGQHTNKQSLEAWGYRLGILKGEYTGGWAAWSQEMEDYNVQDVVVTDALWVFLREKCKVPTSSEALSLEMAVAPILARQERYGFYFDQEAAAALYVKLSKRRLELEAILKARFKPFYVPNGAVRRPTKEVKTQNEALGLNYKAPIYEKGTKPVVGAKRTPRKLIGYKFKTCDTWADAPYSPIKLVEFNPASRDHVANRLTRMYGWKPVQFTDDGKPKVDEGVLKGLPFPEANTIDEYFTVEKRIGQLAEGAQACLKKVGKDSRMHGAVNTNGTVTGRMSHSHPNVAQTPANHNPYGKEFRACYRASDGKELVGVDAAALEGCCLAHYMAIYDGGEYAIVVTSGRKEDGTDVHSVTMKALEIDSRDDAKTWYYAYLYGAGDAKLGSVLTKLAQSNKTAKRGKQSRENFQKNLPALGKLADAVKARAKKLKYLKGLDGRWLLVRSDHAALNTLLQSAGAVLMKRALVILDATLQKEGYVPGVNYEFVANVHDEWQIECDIGLGSSIGPLAVNAIREAGESFRFRCPLSGEARVGRTWADTH